MLRNTTDELSLNICFMIARDYSEIEHKEILKDKMNEILNDYEIRINREITDQLLLFYSEKGTNSDDADGDEDDDEQDRKVNEKFDEFQKKGIKVFQEYCDDDHFTLELDKETLLEEFKEKTQLETYKRRFHRYKKKIAKIFDDYFYKKFNRKFLREKYLGEKDLQRLIYESYDQVKIQMELLHDGRVLAQLDLDATISKVVFHILEFNMIIFVLFSNKKFHLSMDILSLGIKPYIRSRYMTSKIHYPQEAYATFLRVWYHLIPQLLRPFNLNRNQTFYLNGVLSNAIDFIDYFQDDTTEYLKKNSLNWKKLSKEINFPTRNKDYIISQLEKQFNQFFVTFKEDEKKICIANLLRDISRLRVYTNNWDEGLWDESILFKEVDDKDNGEKRNIDGLRNFFNFLLLTFEDICSNFGRDKVDEQLKIFLNFILNQTEFKGEDKNVEDYEKIFKDTNPLDNDRKNKILHLKDYIDDAMQNIDLREMFSYAFFNLIEEFEFDDYIISTKQSNFESNFNEFFTLYSFN